MYDYLLAVGPGRSGTEFLYRIFQSHPDLVFPEIKEGGYYRSLKLYAKAQHKRHNDRELLCDIANFAYRDPTLLCGINHLKTSGARVLLIVIIRDHQDRAISMMRFRRSRGEFSALFGNKYLEKATVRDMLLPQALKDIFGLNVDIITVSFPTLVKDTGHFLDALSDICGIHRFDKIPQDPVNESVRARYIPLSALGKICSWSLRKLGFRHLLQRIKDNESIRKIFFVPLNNGQNGLHLSEESLQALESAYIECCSVIEDQSEPIGEGLYFRKSV